jgi:5-methylcytosine-specific restriction endonuclease McrA
MSRYISENDKKYIIQRASNSCEYCTISNSDVLFPHQIDHIISIKHGGNSELENLAYACFVCNNAKGSDIGTILLPERKFTRLFNPRIDKWSKHFEISDGLISPKTLIAEATIKVLKLNEIDRIIERQ